MLGFYPTVQTLAAQALLILLALASVVRPALWRPRLSRSSTGTHATPRTT
jgi:hypothetical protein